MFTNPIVGGIQLIRNAISSVNYVPGVSGWIIRKDGTFEFAGGSFTNTVTITKTTAPGTTTYPIGYRGSTFKRLDNVTVSYRGAGTTFIRDVTNTVPIVISNPAALKVDDVMVAWIAINPITVTLTPPAGWTQLFLDTDTTVRYYGFYKVATAADVVAGNASFSSSATCTAVGVITSYVGVDVNEPVPEPFVTAINTGAASTSHVTGTYKTNGDRIIVSSCAIGQAANVNTFTSPNTERVDAQNAAGAARVSLAVSDTNGPVAPFNGTKTFTSVFSTTDAVKVIGGFKRASFGSYITIDIPSGVQPGDLLIAFLTMNIAGAWEPPPGWFTLGFQDDGANMRTYCFWKVATRAEPVNYRFYRLGTAVQVIVGMLAYYNTDPSNPIGTEWTSKAETAVTTTHTTTALTPASNDRWLIYALTTFNNLGITVTAPDTERMDLVGVEVTPVSLAVYDTAAAIPAASISKTMTSSIATDNSAMWAVAIRPKPPLIDPGGTQVLASIADDGSASFPEVVTNDLIFGDTPVVNAKDWYARAPRGIVARVRTPESLGTHISSTTSNGTYGNYVNVFTMPFNSEGAERMYRIKVMPFQMAKTGHATGQTDRLRLELWESTTTVPTTRLVGIEIEAVGGGASFEGRELTWDGCGLIAGNHYITVRIAWNQSTNNLAFGATVSPNDFYMDVEDIGVDPGQFGAIGGPGGAVLVTKDYVATWSRSYDGSNNPIPSPDADQNIYRSDFDLDGGRPAYGSERSLLGFDGATMRADLTGKVIISAKLYMYPFVSEDTLGTLQYKTHQSTSAPATYNLATLDAEDFLYEKTLPLGGWNIFNAFDVSSGQSLISRILGGRNGIALIPGIFGVEATGFRGYGFSTSFRPYIRVQYYQ